MRILLLSDIHSNLAAFEAVLADAGTFDKIWCLGDLVGYGPQPNECIDRLMDLPNICVAGNHDWAAIGQLDVSMFNPDAMRACLWTREQLTPHHVDVLRSLPDMLVDGEFTIVHGSPSDPIWEYVSAEKYADANWSSFDTVYCLVGHTHVPVVFQYAGIDKRCREMFLPWHEAVPLGRQRLFLNPGGVGQPRNNDPRACYAILDLAAYTVEQRRVAYPVADTQRLMLAAGLPARLVTRLSLGW